MSFPVITIDGPSGVGKGTISKRVAQQLGFHYLDSGALYRLTALDCLNKGIDCANEKEIAHIARQLNVHFELDAGDLLIRLEGVEVTRRIREESVGMAASQVAAYPMVRDALLQRQRDFLQAPGLVTDGRDMGTTVFPHANAKFFLTASAKERADRRLKQLADGGVAGDHDQILADIERRDEADRSRATSPLVAADDALHIVTDDLSIEGVLDRVMQTLHVKLAMRE